MAYSNIVGCDLCDVIDAWQSTKLQSIEIEIKSLREEVHKKMRITLCARCAEPITAVFQAQQERGEKRATDELNARVLAAVNAGKI